MNLIGEHVDYHGLPVLPMALERGVRVAFEPTGDGMVVLENAEDRWGTRSFALSGDLPPGPAGDWGNYAMAATVAVVREFGVPTGLRGVVSSDLPHAAGLSSSSALVVAVARALLHASGIEVAPLQLADVLARGERFAGTEGGGMDQAASLTGRAGHALLIGFDPVSSTPVPWPREWSVVVAHTGVTAEKSGEARSAYNARRRETAAAFVDAAARLGVPGARPLEVLEAHGAETVADALRGLADRGGEWAVHAATEYGRVHAAVAAMQAGDLPGFGRLLDASHASLRDVYQVSHPALEALTEAARRAGAAGARLTGAGFGGCMIAVCAAARRDAVHESLARAQSLLSPVPTVYPFATVAGPGAGILD